MSIVTISPTFEVVIPLEIREALKLEAGQKLEAVRIDDRIELIPIRPMTSMRGFARGIDTSVPRDGDRV